MCALPAVPQFVELAVVVFVELFTVPSEKARVWGIEREEFLWIRKRGRGRDGEGDVARGRGKRRLSDGVRMSLIKVLNRASCIHQVFFWFPCVFLLG